MFRSDIYPVLHPYWKWPSSPSTLPSMETLSSTCPGTYNLPFLISSFHVPYSSKLHFCFLSDSTIKRLLFIEWPATTIGLLYILHVLSYLILVRDLRSKHCFLEDVGLSGPDGQLASVCARIQIPVSFILKPSL